jgi:hypothetical protein
MQRRPRVVRVGEALRGARSNPARIVAHRRTRGGIIPPRARRRRRRASSQLRQLPTSGRRETKVALASLTFDVTSIEIF